MINDALLIKVLKRHTKNSIEALIKKYTPYVSTVVYNTVGSTLSCEDMEEVVQDVFLAIWHNAQNITNLKAYIGVTARNMALNKLRETTQNVQLNQNIPSEEPDGQTRLEEKEMTNILYEAIKSLGEPDSEIFFRYYYDGEKIKDIAAVLNLSDSTVKSKLKRGKEKLSKRLSERRDVL